MNQAVQERNQEATLYVGGLDTQADEEILLELFTQCGPVHSVYIPRDRITSQHSGYGFVEFRNEGDADYALKLLNNIKLYAKPLKLRKASSDRLRTVDVGANLFIGNLDPYIDEQLLEQTFSVFGLIVQPIKLMTDSTKGKCFAFVNYDNFDSSDAAIRTMNGQWLGGRQITVQYSYKKDATTGAITKERHGSEAERQLAANAPRGTPAAMGAVTPVGGKMYPPPPAGMMMPPPPHPMHPMFWYCRSE